LRDHRDREWKGIGKRGEGTKAIFLRPGCVSFIGGEKKNRGGVSAEIVEQRSKMRRWGARKKVMRTQSGCRFMVGEKGWGVKNGDTRTKNDKGLTKASGLVGEFQKNDVGVGKVVRQWCACTFEITESGAPSAQ